MNTISRGSLLSLLAAGGASFSILTPAKAATALRVGYLHTLAVDGQIWIAQASGAWQKEGIDIQLTRFDTGIALFQALVGGSIDVLSTGAVISNFPARGQGKVFLINDVEWATAQLWARPESGIKSIADLKGKKIATTAGTTANVFLYEALKSAGLDIAKDVEIINQPMPQAVTAFIAGAVPAVALWVPFNLQVEQQVPGAKMLVDASKYYPQAAIVDGWAARNDFYASPSNKDVLRRFLHGWIAANDALVKDPDRSLSTIGKQYDGVTPAQMRTMYQAEKVFASQDWVGRYKDGTVSKWLQHVTDVYVALGAMQNPTPASTYFDPTLYLSVV
jgi:NitT/TauT family transport system substrate-binding protein